MQRRPIGASGILVSPLALGSWAFGGAPEMWGRIDDRESTSTIHYALDNGLNFIDTAPIYGNGHAETIVGRAIKGRRDEVVVATKCGSLPPSTPGGKPGRCLRKKSIFAECDASLRRLGCDHIDLYQCHWPDPDTPLEESMAAMTELLEVGKVRAIGVSNFSSEQVARARELAPVVSLQPPFSLLQRRAAEDLIPLCRSHDIAVLPYSPLAKGLLTGKFDASSTPTGVRSRDPEFLGRRFERNLAAVEALREIAAALGVSVAQLSLQWLIGFEGVTAPIVGAKRPSQLDESLGALGFELSESDRARIDDALAEVDARYA